MGEQPDSKPKLVQLPSGPDMTFEDVLEFMEKFLGRKATPEEIAELRREYGDDFVK